MNNAALAARAFSREAARPGAVVGTALVVGTTLGHWDWDDTGPFITVEVTEVDFLANGKVTRLDPADVSQRTYHQVRGAVRGDVLPFALHPSEAARLGA